MKLHKKKSLGVNAVRRKNPIRSNTYVEEITDTDGQSNVVYIGDPDRDTFSANISMEFWGEDHIDFDLPGVNNVPIKRDGSKVTAKDGSMSWYRVDNKLKWEFYFNKKPSSNIYQLKLGGNWRDFRFAYQTPFNPAFTTSEDRDGVEWLVERKNGEVRERPRSVDGSYAVFHKTKTHHRKESGKNYRTGKVLHVDVPRATDANGRSAWCRLHIDEKTGTYEVKLPKTFMGSARYPVKINDTFGYELVGLSGYSVGGGDLIAMYIGLAPEDGDITTVHYYEGDSDSGDKYHGMYSATGPGEPDALVFKNSVVTDSSSGWKSITPDTSQTITDGTGYFVAVQPENSFDSSMRYDTDAAYDQYKNNEPFGTFDDPWDTVGDTAIDNHRFSAYVTYSTGASPGMTLNTGYWVGA